MKYVILPIWAVIKTVFRLLYVILFMGLFSMFVILKTLWDFKFNTKFIRNEVDDFLYGLSHSEYTHTQYYQTPKSLWDYIWNGLKDMEVSNDKDVRPTIKPEYLKEK